MYDVTIHYAMQEMKDIIKLLDILHTYIHVRCNHTLRNAGDERYHKAVRYPTYIHTGWAKKNGYIFQSLITLLIINDF